MIQVDELRYDFKLAYNLPSIESIEVSMNYRRYWPYGDTGAVEDEYWGAIKYIEKFGQVPDRT